MIAVTAVCAKIVAPIVMLHERNERRAFRHSRERSGFALFVILRERSERQDPIKEV